VGLHLVSIYPWLLCAIVPIKSYSNAEDEKDKILKENKNKSGIYMWKNNINDKQYIGSAVDLSKRLSNYYSTTYMEDALKISNSHIYRALLKNGYENFSITILEYCEPEQCLEREDYYLSCLPHEYNILPKAGSWLGHKHSDETKKILSEANTGEKNPMFGKTGENNTMFGKPRPSGAGRPSQQIEVTDIKNNTTTTYNSMEEAAKALDLSSDRIISNYILRNQKKPYKGQYTFKKI